MTCFESELLDNFIYIRDDILLSIFVTSEEIDGNKILDIDTFVNDTESRIDDRDELRAEHGIWLDLFILEEFCEPSEDFVFQIPQRT